MFRSWKIGRLAGIDLYLHSTFLLLLAWIGLTGLSYGDPVMFGLNLLLPVILFGIVVLHELGHALAARHFGIGTRDITLYPIGGVARLNAMPRHSHQEMVVAAAGPAVNFALAGVAWLVSPLLAGTPILAFLAGQFITFNLTLALFNLLPAFPMDGGRILRAYLARKGDFLKATRTAAGLGKKMAWAFGIVGLLSGSVNLVVLAVFVWIAATAELAQARLEGFMQAQRSSPSFFYITRVGPRDRQDLYYR